MPFNQNIPQAADQLRDSQGDLLANFQDIYTFVGVNHAIFGNPNEGKHKWVSFPEEAAGPATLLNEMALYTKQSALSGVAELFVRRENNGDEVEFTSADALINGWTRLPSGILIKWGQDIAIGPGFQIITYPVGAGIPVFNNVYNLLVSDYYVGGVDPDTKVTVAGIGLAATFDVYVAQRTAVAPAANGSFFWLAIGD